jgi:hypothetical protein
VEGGRKVVELVNDGNTATTTGRRHPDRHRAPPAVQGLGLEAAGVAYDAEAGIHVDDFLRTSNPRIYAAGDVCLEHQFTNTAEASARIVVRNALLLGRQRMSALTIPWCTYTDPEVAHVGLYVKAGARAPHSGQDLHDPDARRRPRHRRRRGEGFVKIHVREGSDRSWAPPSWPACRGDDQQHLAGDGGGHRPAQAGQRHPRLPDPGRGDSAGGGCLRDSGWPTRAAERRAVRHRQWNPHRPRQGVFGGALPSEPVELSV